MLRPAVLSLPLLAAFAGVAAAQEPQGDWIVTLRGNARLGPAYPGAKAYGFTGFPSVSFRKSTARQTFSAPDDNISFALYDDGWLRAGPSGRFIAARRAKDHASLNGIHDVNWTVEFGGFVEFWPIEKVRARVDLRQAVNGHQGFVADLGADYVETMGPWTFSLGPRLSVGDARYARAWFGVTPAEALANGRVTPFQASPGINALGVTASATYTFSPQWNLTAYARYDNLVGAAASSPVVRVLGSEQQATFGLKLAYSFGVKGF